MRRISSSSDRGASPSRVAARFHADLSARLASAGQTVGAHDLIIASTAMARGLDVITRDERSFPKVPSLSVIRW